MKAKELMTLLTVGFQKRTDDLKDKNQTVNNNTFNKNQTEGNGEHCLDAYAAMGILQLL